MAASTLRRTGLCKDHFHATCFVDKDGRLFRKAIPKAFVASVHGSAGAPNVPVMIDVEEPCVVSEGHTVESTIRRLGQLPSSQSDFLMHDKSAKSPNCTRSTSAVSIVTGGFASTATNTEFSVFEHVRKYRRVALDFSESDDEQCTWRNIEPKVQSTTPSCALPTVDTLQRLTARLQKKIGHLKRSNEALKRKNGVCQKTIFTLRRKLKRASAKSERLARKAKKESVDEFLDRQTCTEPAARTMVQLQLHRKNAVYSEEEKDLAKQLYYYSASAYTRLRKAGCSFPSESSVRTWVSEVDIKPGFCNFIFEKLTVKVSKLPPEERVCAVKFDEMTIKVFEEYCQKFDCIEGLVDLGSLGRKDERARYVFLMCADGLNANNPWRQPLAYFLTGSGMKAFEIHAILKECLCRLSAAGAEPALITCDQGPSNRSLFNSYLKVSVEKPFFTIGDKDFLASFDFPHLIKRLLSTLRTHKMLYCKGEVIVNYQDFIDTWEYDNCSTTSHLLPHITKAHLFPSSFEAMNVKRAFQILSHTYAAAILIAGHDPQGLKSKTWQDSAAFGEYMNKVIDASNAYKSLCTNPAKRPLADRNPEIEKTLVEFVQWSADWTVRTNTKTNTMKTVPCLKGLSLSVNAIIETYRRIKSKHPEFELAAALCNQDSVEHLFSKLRQRGGHNPNPTARMVRLSLRHILSTGYIGGGSRGNVECPEAAALIEPSTMVARAFERSNGMFENPTEHDRDEELIEIEEAAEMLQYQREAVETATASEPPNDNVRSVYEQNAVNYFAGYVGQRQMRKYPCDNCRNDILKTPMDERSSTEMYTEFREYGHQDAEAPAVTWLSRPTEKFESIVGVQLEAFGRLWKKHWVSNGILNNLGSEIIKETTQVHSDWFHEHHECREHRVELLHFMIKVKLFAQTKFNNRADRMQITATRAHNKSKKLQKIQGI